MQVEWIKWPSWIGTPSQVGLLLVVLGTIVVAWIKIWPRMRELNIGERQSDRDMLIKRLKELRSYITACEEKCDKLRDKIANEALQRLQSEISLVNILIEVLDAPALRAVLQALEQRRVAMTSFEQVTMPPNVLHSQDGTVIHTDDQEPEGEKK